MRVVLFFSLSLYSKKKKERRKGREKEKMAKQIKENSINSKH